MSYSLVVAGSRTLNPSAAYISNALGQAGWELPSLVLSGCARGVDRAGEAWARHHNISIRFYPADWNRHGKRAGYLRNAEMAREGDRLLAIWDGQSKGTSHMIDLMRASRKPVHVVEDYREP